MSSKVLNEKSVSSATEITSEVETEVNNAEEKQPKQWLQLKTKIVWVNLIIAAIWHAISVYYLFTFPYRRYRGLLLWAFIVAELNALGISGGAHRLWSHRSYKATAPLQIFLAICYYTSGLHSITRWITDHRTHHKFTYTDADPYTYSRGFVFSHVGWVLMKRHPDFKQRSATVDISDIVNNPIVQFFDQRWPYFWFVFNLILPVFIPVYFFNQELKAAIITQWFMRYVYILHAASSVNSFAHWIGNRPYDRSNTGGEIPLVSLFTSGEGWHNYHHAFPWDYKISEFGAFFLDRTTAWINLFAKLGLAYDLREAESELIKKVVESRGDGSHPICKFY